MTVEAPPRLPDRDELQALIEEARRRARRRRHRRLWMLAALIIVGMAIYVAVGRGGSGRSGARGSGTAGLGVESASPRSAEYWYTRTVVAAHQPLIGMAVPLASETIETWIGADGAWRRRAIEPSDRSLSSDMIIGGDGLFPPQANATWSVNGMMTNGRDPGDGLFTYRQLESLPTSISALRDLIQRAVRAQAERDLDHYVLPGPDHRAGVARLRSGYLGGREGLAERALIAISDLDASPVRPGVRAALLDVAETVPGVAIVRGVRDGLGRLGVAVSTAQGPRLIFSPRTGALLEGVTGTIVARGPVRSINAVPAHVAPIAEPAGLRPPQLTISPRIGTPATVFTVRLQASGVVHRVGQAPAMAAFMFGPTGLGCFYWMSKPPFVRIPPGTVSSQAGQTTYTYSLSASTLDRGAWCAGRYVLVTSPQPLPAQPIAGKRVAVRERLSHAAAYFTVR